MIQFCAALLAPYAPPGTGSCMVMPPMEEVIMMSLGEPVGDFCSIGQKAWNTMSGAIELVSKAARKSSMDVSAAAVKGGQMPALLIRTSTWATASAPAPNVALKVSSIFAGGMAEEKSSWRMRSLLPEARGMFSALTLASASSLQTEAMTVVEGLASKALTRPRPSPRFAPVMRYTVFAAML